jgi:hypothetical protein
MSLFVTRVISEDFLSYLVMFVVFEYGELIFLVLGLSTYFNVLELISW